MGAYLSEPVTEKISNDKANEVVKYGASSMQGWRTSQEDAHTCRLSFDDRTSLFAVFDGHGGAEVAQYCAKNLPNFLKSIPEYKEGDLKSALERAFIEFDKLLTKPSVVEELKVLAGSEYCESDVEEDKNEASLLKEEAELSLEDLIARYCYEGGGDEAKKIHLPTHLLGESSKKKIISPFLRGKKDALSSEEPSFNKPSCSSSTSSDQEASNRIEPCTSSSSSSNSSTNLPNGKILASCHLKSGSENDSVSSSVTEALDDKNDTCKVSSTRSLEKRDALKCESNISESSDIDSGNASNSPCSDSKPSNGETSQEKESFVSTSTDASPKKKIVKSNECNDTSSTSMDEPTSSSKGKGKKKKVLPSKVNPPASSPPSLYQAFLNDFDESEDETDDFRVTSESSDEVEGEGEASSEDEDESEEEVESEDEVGTPFAFPVSSSDYDEPGKDSGCTAVVAVLKGNQLYVANAGDSRCVISRLGNAVDMSIDHKPEDLSERRRIVKAGGKVTSDGRINGGLNLSRAIGDHAYKANTELDLKDQMITSFPDIKVVTIEPERDEFMVLACDGIWNSMNSQEVVDFVRERIGKKSLSAICEELFDDCLASDTDGDGTGCDNMTCVIVQFCNVIPLESQRDVQNSEEQGTSFKNSVAEVHPDEPESKRLKAD